MSIDLSEGRDPVDLINSIWEARRGNRRDLLPQLLDLLKHAEATIRGEAVSLVFAKWKEGSHRHRLEGIIQEDIDPGVRARALGALATISSPSTRISDIKTLRRYVLNGNEPEQVRKAAYESLVLLARNEVLLIDDNTDIDEDIDLEWVRSL